MRIGHAVLYNLARLFLNIEIATYSSPTFSFRHGAILVCKSKRGLQFIKPSQ